MVPVLLMVMMLTVSYTSGSCPNNCTCLFRGGQEMANCSYANFSEMPTMSADIQILEFNNNRLRELPRWAFQSVHKSLHKLHLQDNSIERIDQMAFSGMGVLIEIYLSRNNISYLDPQVFQPCVKIREIIIESNPIKTLKPGLFSNLTYLQKVVLANCQIASISEGTFYNVSRLKTIDLRGNRLTTLDLNIVSHLPRLIDLGLSGNPWNCDCHLRPLRNWVIQKNLYTHPTDCSTSVNEKINWKELDENEFACKPEVISAVLDGSFLGCKVSGDPLPNVQWSFNNKPVNNHSYTGAEYILHSGAGWFNLTVRHASHRDSGDYKCSATNPAGESFKILDVRFTGDDDIEPYGSTSAMFEVWPLIVGVIVGALFLLAIVLLMCCCLCKKQRREVTKKDHNGMATLPSEEKTLMHSVNPVQKPPRRQETGLNTSETELLDSGSLPFNENGSILSASITEGQTTPAGTLVRQRGQDVGDPPDLLAFPGVSTSTKPLLSSIGSPNRPQGLAQFGTLPYARSHSPFSPPMPVVPRTCGYVTIPRRPRVPSWTASLSPVLVSPDDSYCEPVYDNLGPRTTLDGSSVLSLNKIGATSPAYKNRPLPHAPHEPIDRRQSWTRSTPDGCDERESLIAASPVASIAPTKKIPPNVPPKPKKKTVFQDEGEDGTEV